MNKHRTLGNFSAILATLIFLMVAAPARAQTPPPEQNSRVLPSASPTPPLPSNAATQDQSTEQQAAVYGLQGVLVETLDGRVVSMQSPDDAFNPASTIKLATALVALRTFGPGHRFTTGVWTTGTFDKTTGTITGDLYLSGRDPSFHYEHAVMVARQLNLLGIRTVTGNLVVAPGFTLNFNWSARRSGELFYDTLDSTRRPAEATRAWLYERTTLADKASLQMVPSVAVMGEVQINPVPPDA
ncbi:MAG: D-alanyl-D-alanine carboxypeptidase, partial [Acidobacteriota bacterium]